MTVTIENNTPWDTEAFTAFLVPLCLNTPIPNISVELLRAQPGQNREEQPLYSVRTNLFPIKNGNPWNRVKVYVISPRRVMARTDLLDRMAQSFDLATHEIALPERIVSGIVHAFQKLATLSNGAHRMGDQWEFERHFNDDKHRRCECKKPPAALPPLIRGNTLARTTPPVNIAKLKQRGRWAVESAESYRKKMEKCLNDAQKIAARILRAEAKAKGSR